MNITEAKWFFGGFYAMVSNKVLALRWTKYKHSAVIRTAPLIWPYVRHFQRLVHIKEMRKYWISVTPLVLSREAYGNVGKNGKWNKGNMEPPAWSPKWELRIEEKLVSFFGIWGRERGGKRLMKEMMTVASHAKDSLPNKGQYLLESATKFVRTLSLSLCTCLPQTQAAMACGSLPLWPEPSPGQQHNHSTHQYQTFSLSLCFLNLIWQPCKLCGRDPSDMAGHVRWGREIPDTARNFGTWLWYLECESASLLSPSSSTSPHGGLFSIQII